MTATANAESPRYQAPALEKGLDILELLSDHPGGLTPTEVAQHLGRSIHELFRMLMCLQRRGYIAPGQQEDRYVLTLRMFELSHRFPPVKRLISEAMPEMLALTRMLDQSCHLTVLHNGRSLVAAQVDSPGDMGFSVRMGAQIDMLGSASGRVLLAFQPPPDRDRLLGGLHHAPFWKDAAALARHLQRVRTRGHEAMDSTQIRGLRAVSFPILNFTATAVASITVPYLDRLDAPERPGLDQATRELGAAASRISQALGATPTEPRTERHPA